MTHQLFAHKKGFTLIETIIYIGLSGLVLAGIISAAYPMFTSTDKIVANVTTEGEVAFIMHKISWAVSSSKMPISPAIILPSTEASADNFSVTNQSGGTIKFRQALTASNIEISEDGCVTWEILNASRVPITNFLARHVYNSASGFPRYLEISFMANGKPFGPVREYLPY